VADNQQNEPLRGQFNKPSTQGDRIYVDTSLNGTARVQIDTRAAFENLMDAHVRQWQSERKRLSMTSNNVPDFDLGSRGHRSILSDYEERRTEWERKAEKIEVGYEQSREQIRKTGTTLQDEFLVPDRQQSRGRAR